MPVADQHVRLSRLILPRVGCYSLGKRYQQYIIDCHASHPDHRAEDYMAWRMVHHTRSPVELAEWTLHLAADYDLHPRWRRIALSPARDVKALMAQHEQDPTTDIMAMLYLSEFLGRLASHCRTVDAFENAVQTWVINHDVPWLYQGANHLPALLDWLRYH